MNHYIIGSRWFKQLFPDNLKVQKRCKDNADYDVLVETEPSKQDIKYFKDLYGTKTEVHCIEPLWEYIKLNESFDEGWVDVNTLQNIYFTLKTSHVSFHRIHSKKTFYDLFLMSEEGCQIIEPLFYELHKIWSDKFGEPWRADFTKESSDFFDDAVSRENVHDELHELVAYYDHPAFKFLQEPDQTTVWVCPEKFKNTTEHIRQRVVIEEAQTLALERFILPNILPHKQIAYTKMIEALVDRLAPLWMTVYILNNFYYFLTYKEDYGRTKETPN